MTVNSRKFFVAAFLLCLALLGGAEGVSAQEVPVSFASDTLSLRLEFPSGESEVRLGHGGNDSRLYYFREMYERAMKADGAFVSGVSVRTTASPEGSTADNIGLLSRRGENVRTFVCTELGLSPFSVSVSSSGEDWEAFREAVSALSPQEAPWRNEALEVISQKPRWVKVDEGLEDSRKGDLRSMYSGKVWDYLVRKVFPVMKADYVDVALVVSRPVVVEPEEKPEELVKHDTIIVEKVVTVEKYYDGKLDYKFANRVAGKKFLFAARTNIFAIPLINVGLEFPFGNHWSVGVDYYYPFIKRNSLHKDCFEFIGYDLDVRYYLGSDRFPKESRLLGHSFGIYGAGGHYDFEDEWSGYQGSFFNFGFDWKYSWPVFRGRMHMEIEIGLGIIYSDAQPYDCFVPYGECFRRPEERKIIRWYGPTRAQFNLVVPFYRKPIVNKRREKK